MIKHIQLELRIAQIQGSCVCRTSFPRPQRVIKCKPVLASLSFVLNWCYLDKMYIRRQCLL